MGNHSETGEVLEEALKIVKLKKRNKNPTELNDENGAYIQLDDDIEDKKKHVLDE